jgi:hypothetical protein
MEWWLAAYTLLSLVVAPLYMAINWGNFMWVCEEAERLNRMRLTSGPGFWFAVIVMFCTMTVVWPWFLVNDIFDAITGKDRS